MKKLFLMLMLCAPMTLFAQKFGHLDSQALLQSLPEATAVQSKLEAKGKEYQKQLEDMQAELQRQAEAYDKAKSQQTAQDNQKAFNEEQQKQLGPVLEKVRNAIAAVAKAGNYVYIMEKANGQPLYINEALSKDVTAEVKAQLAKMK